MALTETTTLDEVKFDVVKKTITVTWRDRIFKDGIEIDSARTARDKTYGADDAVAFGDDLGADAAKYSGLL